MAEGHEFSICDKRLTRDITIKTAEELAEMQELTSLTFENNDIEDEESVCVLLRNLANFDKLESLNIR
jgi:Leucine-rich repeat (LRR) protein